MEPPNMEAQEARMIWAWHRPRGAALNSCTSVCLRVCHNSLSAADGRFTSTSLLPTGLSSSELKSGRRALS